MIYGYARVSTLSQAKYGYSLEDQRNALLNAGAERVFEDVFTGTTMDRPAWNELCSSLKRGDTLVVSKLDRVARTMKGGCEAIRDLIERGVKVSVLNIGQIDDTPFGRFVLNLMFALAEFDHDSLVEHLAACKEVARRNDDFKEGRPRIDVDENRFRELKTMVEMGVVSKREAARRLGVSEATFRRRFSEEVTA